MRYAIAVVALLAAVAAIAHAAQSSTAAPVNFSVKGGNVSAWNVKDVAKILADAERLGLDTLTVPVRVTMASATSSTVAIDPASLAFAHQIVNAGGKYRFIVEPYPWIRNGNVAETDVDPADRAAWFTSYQAAVVALAREFPAAAGLYVASNLIKIEGETPRWLALIGAVRAVFPGKVIYRTQWWATAAWAPETIAAYRAKLANPLFGAVDVIAIAAYFELSDLPSPSKDQLKAALRSTTVFAREQNVYSEIMAFQTKWGKPIFLGELSCPGVDLGAQNPWNPTVTAVKNADIQKNYLAAYLETFALDSSKFMGFSLFTIGHPTVNRYELAPAAAEFIRSYRAP